MANRPIPRPSMSPAPLDCSKRKVREARDPVPNAQMKCGLSTSLTAQYSAPQAQRVLSQLCRAMKRKGRHVTVVAAVIKKAVLVEQTLRAKREVIAEKMLPTKLSAVRATTIELPKSLKSRARR